jgi:hypothetical protein
MDILDEITWSDEEPQDDALLFDNFIAMFNINTYIFGETPIKKINNKINKKLGTIELFYKNTKYTAHHSIEYPKIIYNNELYENTDKWICFIKNSKKK